MAKRKIADDIAEEAASLRRKGTSFRAIGETLGIDPRTVKGLVDRMGAVNNKEHWENVDLQLDARYLGEHFHLLQQVAAGVLWAVQTHPKNTGPGVEPNDLLDHQVGSALAQGGEALLVGRGIAKAPIMDRDIEVSPQVSRALLNGLKEHESRLTESLDGRAGWTKRWKRFQVSRKSVIDQARGLFLQKRYENVPASSMAETAVKASFAEIAEGVESHWIVGNPPSFEDPESDAYEWVVEQISIREIRRPLKDSSERIEEAAEEVASAVVGFQLRGKPNGRCFLCPSRNGV